VTLWLWITIKYMEFLFRNRKPVLVSGVLLFLSCLTNLVFSQQVSPHPNKSGGTPPAIVNPLNAFYVYRLRGRVKSVTVKEADYKDVNGTKQVGPFMDTSKLEFDSNGYLVREFGYLGGSLMDETFYKRDAKGWILDQIFQDFTGAIQADWDYEYLSSSPASYRKWHFTKDGLKRSALLALDRNGFVSSEIEYDAQGKIWSENSFRYGKFGLEEAITAVGSPYSNTETNKYDGRGNLVQRTFSGTVTTHIVNSNGDPLQTTYKTGDQPAEVSTFSYTYDSKNNWIQQVVLNNGIPVVVIAREITYYQ
jgi:hypothetical protein